MPALADDSGLEIDALDGAPGVYSADWAGPTRDFGLAMSRVNDELSKRGAWNAASPPRANFISVLCLCWPDGAHEFYEGRVFGHVVWPPRGGNGFGYDPMFVPEGERAHMARWNLPKNTPDRIAPAPSRNSRPSAWIISRAATSPGKHRGRDLGGADGGGGKSLDAGRIGKVRFEPSRRSCRRTALTGKTPTLDVVFSKPCPAYLSDR